MTIYDEVETLIDTNLTSHGRVILDAQCTDCNEKIDEDNAVYICADCVHTAYSKAKTRKTYTFHLRCVACGQESLQAVKRAKRPRSGEVKASCSLCDKFRRHLIIKEFK